MTQTHECPNLVEMVAAVRQGSVSAIETTEACLERIAELDPAIHAFRSVDADAARYRARHVDAVIAAGEDPGLLAGAPIALKDNLCTHYGTTTCGSRILARFRSPYAAHVVDLLLRAGAVPLGKTNMDEFGMGSSTEHSAFGLTRNPWDALRVPGGSSGGSAAAVAAGLVPAALGSDTGGSIRQPASFCGIVGLKPTYGRVSRRGLIAYASSMEQIGPLTRTAKDAALLASVICSHDPLDSTSVNVPAIDYRAVLKRPLEGVRLGVCPDMLADRPADDVEGCVLSAVELLSDAGAEVRQIGLPSVRHAVAAYYLTATAEASANLARYDGVRYGHRTAEAGDIAELYARSRGEAFGPEVKRRIMLGTFALSSGYQDRYYQQATKARMLIKQEFQRAFEQADVIAAPVSPTTAFLLGEKLKDPLAMFLADVYTLPVNLAGLCAISVPCGFDRQGLPVGLQLIGPPFAEGRLLGAAHQYQLRTDHHLRRPPPRELLDASC